MKIIAMINTKKLHVELFRTFFDCHWIFYKYNDKAVNLEFDFEDELCNEFEGELSQLDAINVAIANEEAKEIKADAERMMDNAVKSYYAK